MKMLSINKEFILSFLCISLCLCLYVSNLSAQTRSFNTIVKKADDARVTNKLDEAVALYGKALKLRPKWLDGWWHIGTILYEKDQYADAVKALRNVVALDNKHSAGWGMLGLSEYKIAEYDRAGPSLSRCRSLGYTRNDEVDRVVRYHLGLLYIRGKHFEAAFEVLSELAGYENQKVIDAFGLTLLRMPYLPNEIPSEKREIISIAGQAGFNMASNRRDLGLKALDELLAKYPDDPNAQYCNGVFLLRDQPERALEQFKKVLSMDPNHVPALTQLAFEYLKQNEYETALPYAEKAVEKDPNLFAARNVLGRVLIELNKADLAIIHLEVGINLTPSSPEMHFALSRAYAKAGRKEDAERERKTFQKLRGQ